MSEPKIENYYLSMDLCDHVLDEIELFANTNSLSTSDLLFTACLIYKSIFRSYLEDYMESNGSSIKKERVKKILNIIFKETFEEFDIHIKVE